MQFSPHISKQGWHFNTCIHNTYTGEQYSAQYIHSLNCSLLHSHMYALTHILHGGSQLRWSAAARMCNDLFAALTLAKLHKECQRHCGSRTEGWL